MKDSTKKWLKIADEDLADAKIMLNFKRYGRTCFFSQQAVEKYLKAFLIERDVFNPKVHKTHDLSKLLKHCINIDDEFLTIKELKLEKLSIYAVEPRYDIDFFIKISEEEAKEAVETAEKV